MVRKTPVPQYVAHTYVSFGGVLNMNSAPTEIWQCGMRVMAHGEVGTLHDHDAYLAEINGPLKAWYIDPKNQMPPSSKLVWIKANPIGVTGLYTDPLTHVFDYTPSVGGAGQGGANLDIASVCLSWTTGKSRGTSARGRMYPPSYVAPLAIPNGGVPQISLTTAQDMATGAAHLLDVIANASNAQKADPVICSAKDGSHQKIVGARVGTTVDVQRRRKSALVEVYANGAWTPP